MEAWAFFHVPEERPGLSPRKIDSTKQNADGRVTLYVGPKTLDGYVNNWIPTADKTPCLMFRYCGPEEAFYDESFVLNDVERVD